MLDWKIKGKVSSFIVIPEVSLIDFGRFFSGDSAFTCQTGTSVKWITSPCVAVDKG